MCSKHISINAFSTFCHWPKSQERHRVAHWGRQVTAELKVIMKREKSKLEQISRALVAFLRHGEWLLRNFTMNTVGRCKSMFRELVWWHMGNCIMWSVEFWVCQKTEWAIGGMQKPLRRKWISKTNHSVIAVFIETVHCTVILENSKTGKDTWKWKIYLATVDEKEK